MIFDETKTLKPWTQYLPDDWQLKRIDDVADVLFSNVDKHTEDEEQPVRLCNYVDVYKNEKITEMLDFMEATAAFREIEKFQIKKNDVLSTKDSESPDDIAITALVTKDIPNVLCGYHLAMMRPRSKRICGPFLAWVHASKHFRAQYEARAVGVTRFGLPQYTFRSARVPLPSRQEQERIAAFLDASCDAIDTTMAVKQKQIAVLGAQRESLIECAVTKGLRGDAPMQSVNVDWIDEIPSHWDICRIKRVVSRVDYGISRSTEPEGRYPVLKMGNIQGGKIELRDLDFVEEVADDLLLQNGDILYNRTNSPDQVGKAAIFRHSEANSVTFASYLVRLRTNHRADPHYLNYLINCSGFLFFARKLAIQSVQQSNLNATRYCRLLIPRPPLDEQRAIAVYLDDKTSQIADVVSRIESQISSLTAFRKALIYECVTGQKRISETDLKKVQAYG